MRMSYGEAYCIILPLMLEIVSFKFCERTQLQTPFRFECTDYRGTEKLSLLSCNTNLGRSETMVLGLRSKSRKNSLVDVEYIVHVQEIKPWPPSKSLKSVESVLVQCGNVDKISGSLSSSGVGDVKIEFSESFRLTVTLSKESKSKTRGESFQKNMLEFHLYESGKDNIGQLLGSATINIADYGIIKEITSLYVPLNIKRSFRSTAQPVLFFKVQPSDKDGSTSSSKASLSVTESMVGDNYEDTELAYITDEEEYDCDIPSQSSRTTSSSSLETNKGSVSQKEENVSESVKSCTTKPAFNENPSSNQLENTDAEAAHVKGGLSQSSIQLSSSLSVYSERNAMQVGDVSSTHDIKCSSLPLSYLDNNDESHISAKDHEQESIAFEVCTNAADESRRIQEEATDMFEDMVVSSETYIQVDVDANHVGNNKVTEVVDNQETANDFDDTCTRCSTHEIKETANGFDEIKVELESRVEMLEEELREAAAMEIGLYSVVAEHGGALNKVHAPARRLSRFYFHACKAKPLAKQASAARAALSGLVLVSKSCGNDVPRLAFWLSNLIVMRTIISKTIEELPISSISSCIKINGEGKETNNDFKKSELLPCEENQNSLQGNYDDLEDPQMFTIALENIEAWIFSRIVESVWWQILTPYMQSTAAKDSPNKENVRGHGNFSIDLWKKAYKDACESLCPIRAGGHECGCLPVLAKLVMEQLVDRLDVAMFNAILRESAEEMPTDPVSDPISDSRVLPIPVGISNFGAGVQLKNAVGNWSRWLTDLFGIDDDSPEDEISRNVEKRPESETSFKAFHLLNALSDLMMLPLEMLADRSIRKEVCPVFGLSIIERVLNNYVPDEFCPEPIPDSVYDALDSEDSLGTVGESISCFPVTATPPVYSPPLAASLYDVIGVVGNRALSRSASVIKKSYTSDDELNELDSPISPIIGSIGPHWIYKSKQGRNVVRYKLLREVWTMDT